MKLLYFAWIKTKIGLAEEQITLPDHVTTVGGLVEWLRAQGPGYADALANVSVVRAAVNQRFVPLDHILHPQDEVALFPPVTGG